jgi:hypothetical protein
MLFRYGALKWAGITYLVPVVSLGYVWGILLFAGNDPESGPGDMLRHALVDAPERAIFWWLAALPMICLALSLAYLSAIGRSRMGALALCVAGAILAVAAWLTVDRSIAVFTTLPLVFGLRGASRRMHH